MKCLRAIKRLRSKTCGWAKCQERREAAELEVLGEGVYGFLVEGFGEGDGEFEHGEVVFEVDDGVVGVDVAGGGAEDNGWDAAIGGVDGAGIGAAAAADGDLVGDVGTLCDGDG